MEELFRGTRSELGVADERLHSPSKQSYTRAELDDVLRSLYKTHAPRLIGALDMTLTNYEQLSAEPAPSPLHLGWNTDHSDHIYSALFAHEAARDLAAHGAVEFTFGSYRTYNLPFEAANVPCATTEARGWALNQYGQWDWNWSTDYQHPGTSCSNAEASGWGDPYLSWLAREASARTVGPFSATPIAGTGGCLARDPSGLALGACTDAARFTLDTHGRLIEEGSGLCVDAAAPGLLSVCRTPPSPGQQWRVFTNGQLRTADGRCLAVEGGAPTISECTPWSATPSAPRATFAQRWALQLADTTSSPAFPDFQGWATQESDWGGDRVSPRQPARERRLARAGRRRFPLLLHHRRLRLRRHGSGHAVELPGEAHGPGGFPPDDEDPVRAAVGVYTVTYNVTDAGGNSAHR